MRRLLVFIYTLGLGAALSIGAGLLILAMATGFIKKDTLWIGVVVFIAYGCAVFMWPMCSAGYLLRSSAI